MAPSPKPLLPKVTIKSFDESSTFHTYDSFNLGAADINIQKVDVTIGLARAGVFDITIEDADGNLDPDVTCGNKIFIQAGKTQAGLANLLTGYVRSCTTHRNATNTLHYVLHGFGVQTRFNERISNFFRFADRSSFGGNDPASDTTMRASELFKDLIEDTDHLPIGTPLESFTVNGVDTIAEQIPSIKQPFVEWSAIANRISESPGAIWGVDADEDAFFRYPLSGASGITVKDSVSASDSANTAYIVGPWFFRDSIEKTDGFSNRLYGRGGSQLHEDQSQTTNNASDSLFNTDLAMQFTPTAHNLDTVMFIVSRTGSLAEDITGEVVLDINDEPVGDIVGSFKIWKDLVGTSATTVKVAFESHGKFTQVDKKHWIIMHQNGADASNHGNWHHDNGTSFRSASRSPGGSGSWTVDDTGVGYTFVTLCSRRIFNEASDSISIDKYGVIESVIDVPWILEGRTMDRFLTSMLGFTAKRKRIYTIPRVKAPDTLFTPGKLVDIRDSKAGLGSGTKAELLKAHYVFDANVNGMGTHYVNDLELLTHLP